MMKTSWQLATAAEAFAAGQFARLQGSATRLRRPRGVPWHPSWDWMLGDRLIIWALLIALPAIVIYAIGRLLGFW